jgi:hypothetical protein
MGAIVRKRPTPVFIVSVYKQPRLLKQSADSVDLTLQRLGPVVSFYKQVKRADSIDFLLPK